jgi:hypothetical protein
MGACIEASAADMVGPLLLEANLSLGPNLVSARRLNLTDLRVI